MTYIYSLTPKEGKIHIDGLTYHYTGIVRSREKMYNLHPMDLALESNIECILHSSRVIRIPVYQPNNIVDAQLADYLLRGGEYYYDMVL